MWAGPQPFYAIIVLWIAAAAASDAELEFLSEPISRLVKISESRAVFRCVASPSSAEIRWLYRGHPVTQSQRWIRISDHKLTVLLGRMDRSVKSPHNLNNAYFQCEVRLKGQVLVSAPAKLTVAVLDQFPAQPDAHLDAILGNTAVIPCDPPHSEPIVVTEFNFNQTVISMSTDRQRIMPSGDLQILNVTYQDSGEYRCIANNPYLMKKVISPRKVILRVEEPVELIPPFFVKSPRSRLAVALGSNVTLECAAGGYPVPKVAWHKQHPGSLPHGRHQQLDGNLLIINIRKGDEGVYHCKAENSAGPKISESIHVEVQESPQIVRPPTSVSVEAGDNITLNCLTRGHPKPSLIWMHNGRTIIGSHPKSRSSLVILNANLKHSGIYQCFASNKLGTVYASIAVTVTMGNNSILFDYDDGDNYEVTEDMINLPKPHHGKDKEIDEDISDPIKEENGHDHPPKKHHKKKHSKGVKLIPPSKPYVTRLSNSSVMVRWNVPRNDGLPVIFFKVQYKEVGKGHTDWETVEEDIAAHIHSYAVTDLKPGAAYRFQVAAVYSNNDNKSGPMSAKFVLLKSSPMEKPSPAPTITYAEAASPSAITLHWENDIQNSVPIVGYFIHYRATHTAGKYLKVTVLGASTRSHIISHLLPDTGYDMKMQSFNDAGTSDFSNIYTAKTKPAEIIPGIHSRKKTHQSDGSDISHTETVSSKNSESNLKLYIIIGCVFGILLLIVLLCTFVFFRQKHNMESTCDNESDQESDDPLKMRNGYVTSNGYLAVNKMGLNVNPLSRLDIEDDEKPDELENIVSNNNEIIRLQTFNVDADHSVNPLLNGSEVNESEFNGEEAESVIVSCNSGVSTELKQEN